MGSASSSRACASGSSGDSQAFAAVVGRCGMASLVLVMVGTMPACGSTSSGSSHDEAGADDAGDDDSGDTDPANGEEDDGGDDDDGDGDDGDTGSGVGECGVPPPTPVIHSVFESDDWGPTRTIEHIVADAEYLYFADDLGIHRVARCGAEAELLVPDARPFNDGLAIAADRLVWTSNTEAGWSLNAASTIDGSTVELTAFEGYTHHVRVDGTDVVWNGSVSGFPDESRLYAIDSDGSNFRTLAVHRYGWSFDVEDGFLYAAGYDPRFEPAEGGRLIWKQPLTGGDPIVIADGFGDEYPTGVVAGGDDIYYLRASSSEPVAVEVVAKDAGARRELDLGGLIPDHLVYAAGRLYGVELTGAVWEIVDGDAPKMLGTSVSQLYEGDVFADADGVFMTEWQNECLETDWSQDKVPTEICVRSRTEVWLWFLGR